ncbi:NAD(P)(+) transhydrogenase (Re/Si-specific) subunit beta [Candidatus Hydrogenosomobacter endosymbioticus]|uniref:NAD(P) transhydrogenase subunit beta n=1 Tax=Candidatus Hydrogenosomobacter endosymbioticus TaxID=2558174 RepID=A0ABN6L2G3_9PROT|nr:NAD(P)(+) transhydrogenase (Re/Si-specific) subunit beta [Candidatus Hydrogenosomobacter endosymbioticus]BDB96008.1 NAD(P) transhydrogenase subunit beta [Candidatus Hydrogenosomobacter endosymbioticus]
MFSVFVLIAYVLAMAAVVVSFSMLSSISSSRKAVAAGAVGIGAALLGCVSFDYWFARYTAVFLAGGAVGVAWTYMVKMTSLPQLMAAFHSLVGLAAVLIAIFMLALSSTAVNSVGSEQILESITAMSALDIGGGAVIGAVTFAGSIIAFCKLQGILSRSAIISDQPIWFFVLCFIQGIFLFLFMVFPSVTMLIALSIIACALGVFLVVPIGGADMPVVISILNSLSGWAAVSLGFASSGKFGGSFLLIVVGSIVGASGAMLSYVMCIGMNRSLFSIFSDSMKNTTSRSSTKTFTKSGETNSAINAPKTAAAEEAAFIMKNADSIVIIPGYGMAAAHAQYALKEMADLLKKIGVTVRYGIHPVAGRMPGHMNVLLAEANIPSEDVFEMDDINNDMPQTDVVFVIGANDITNPSARTDKSSPIYGMPVFDADKARCVLFVKRSAGGVGYSGVDNPLFHSDKTFMIYSDAKKICESIARELHE